MTSIKLQGTVRVGTVILLGPSGVGKTTLAQAMGLSAGPSEHTYFASKDGPDTLVIWLIPAGTRTDVKVHAVAYGSHGGCYKLDTVHSSNTLVQLATTLRTTFALGLPRE
jgi:energy-coupling factor transporter ATP-binding protein EcfA2